MKVVHFVLLSTILSAISFSAPAIDEVRTAIEEAKQIQVKRGLQELEGEASRTSTRPKTCTFMLRNVHGRQSTSSNRETARNSAIVSEACRLLLQRGFTYADLHHSTVINELRRQLSPCPADSDVICDVTSAYRTADGSCNNLVNTTWGMAGTPQLRLLAAAYDGDSFSNPRSRGIGGNPLPNPRTVSNAVHAPVTPTSREVRSHRLTLHTYQFGQFLSHDILLTPTPADAPNCCDTPNVGQCGAASAVGRHRRCQVILGVDNCLPIIVPEGDPFIRFRNNYCMDIARSSSMVCPESDQPMTRQQENALTSFIDGSNVYGSSANQTNGLRNETNPEFMAVEHTTDGDRLPSNPDAPSCVTNADLGHFCSSAGDGRVNVVPSLVSYHTLFVREHNRIAQELSAFHTEPEIIFQETRKILIAVIQKIVSDEFLPAFISPFAMSRYRLGSDHLYEYDDSVNPSISNGFGIAYRLGHSWIPQNMDVFDRGLNLSVTSQTHDTYFNPALTYISGDPNGLEGQAYWMTADNSPETDRIIEHAARDRLFEDENRHSLDLAAININRGRDHGVASYTAYRAWCGLSVITTWSTSPDDNGFTHHTPDNVARLHKVYESPEDIDLFTGALTEIHSPGASIGPTLECILGDQFARLKFGDRFWYEGESANFTTAQVDAIQKHSMSRILCDNYNFDRLHKNAFDATSGLVRCDTVPGMNLSVFNPSASTEPPTTAPSSPLTRPPRTHPPGTRPPRTHPPRTRPPRTHPTRTRPPRTNPPRTRPPRTQPTRTRPPRDGDGDGRPPPPPTRPPRTHPPRDGDDGGRPPPPPPRPPRTLPPSDGDGDGRPPPPPTRPPRTHPPSDGDGDGRPPPHPTRPPRTHPPSDGDGDGSPPPPPTRPPRTHPPSDGDGDGRPPPPPTRPRRTHPPSDGDGDGRPPAPPPHPPRTHPPSDGDGDGRPPPPPTRPPRTHPPSDGDGDGRPPPPPTRTPRTHPPSDGDGDGRPPPPPTRPPRTHPPSDGDGDGRPPPPPTRPPRTHPPSDGDGDGRPPPPK